MTDPAASERAAIATEKERLARQRERRRQSAPEGASGFVLRRWRWLGVDGAEAVEAVTGMLKDIVDTVPLGDSRAVVTRALTGDPDRESMLAAVSGALASMPPENVLRHLRSLWAAGVPWLNEAGMDRCRVLCSSAPAVELAGGRSRAVSGGPAFSLFTTAATRGAVPLPNRYLAEVLVSAPLPVVDDLVDHGGLLPDDKPWQSRDEDEGRYLRARLAPDTVALQDAERLRWDYYQRRHAFLSGRTILRREPEDVWDLLYDVVRDGDVGSVDALDAALPRAQQIELRNLRSGALSGQWALDTVADRGLWRLMSALWSPQETIDPRRSEFYALMALNRAYRLLKAGDVQTAGRQARAFLRSPSGSGPAPVRADLLAEALTVASYTAALDGDLATAEEYAERVADDSPAAMRNLRLVRTWRGTTKNYREVTNPFLQVGLDHGSDDWAQRCIALYREHEDDPAAQARSNRAEDRIREALAHEAGVDVFFQVPLDPSRYRLPTAVPRQLVPPLRPLDRRTPVTSGAQLEALRARAAVELLDDFRTTPPHLDRHRQIR